MAAAYVTCRVLSKRGVQCTAEAVDPGAESKICIRHLAEAARLLRDAGANGHNAARTQRS